MTKRVVVFACLVGCLAAGPGAEAQVIARVDVDSEGQEAALGASVPMPDRAVDSSGRFIVFSSDSDDLVADDGNALRDVFLRDRVAGTTVRVSVNREDGGHADGASDFPAISDSGRFVAFGSAATDLVEGDGNGQDDVFVWDRLTSAMTRVSVAFDGGDADGGSNHPTLSADGRYVAFRSNATDLVSEGANTNGDIYIRDLFLEETTKVTVRHDGSLTELNSWLPSISADGRHVSFTSGDNGLVPDDLISPQDVFVCDLDSGLIERVSVSTAGTEGTDRNGDTAINGDGTVVAWWSRASELVQGDTNGEDDIFVRDRVAGTTTRVNVSSTGEQAEGGGSWQVTISDDGRYVAFCSNADNLVAGPPEQQSGVFSHDRLTGITRRHSSTRSGREASDYSRRPSLTADGAYVVFESGAADLVPGDGNAAQDVFIAWGPDILRRLRVRQAGRQLAGP
jgi:Tol biopolymer transport system component